MCYYVDLLAKFTIFFLFLAASHRAPGSRLASESVLCFRRLHAAMHRSEITSMTLLAFVPGNGPTCRH